MGGGLNGSALLLVRQPANFTVRQGPRQDTSRTATLAEGLPPFLG